MMPIFIEKNIKSARIENHRSNKPQTKRNLITSWQRGPVPPFSKGRLGGISRAAKVLKKIFEPRVFPNLLNIQ
jgi:hypothetical protein